MMYTQYVIRKTAGPGGRRHNEVYMKKKVWLPIILLIALLALAGGGVYAFLYQPMENAFAAAMEASQTAPYAEAQAALAAAVEELEGRPFAEERVAALRARQQQLLLAEADRAEAADQLSYAADLLETLDPARAQALRQTLADREAALARAQALAQAYGDADALEQAGRDEEALAAFLALSEYEDAAQRAEVIETRIAFHAAQAVFTGTNFDEGIAALNALGTAEGQAAAEELRQQKEAWIEARRKQYAAAAQDQLSTGAWHTAAAGIAPWIAGDARYGAAPEQAEKVFSGLASVFYISEGKVYTTGETFGAEETIAALTNVKKVAPGLVHGLFLQADGHVTAVGSKGLDRLPQEEWTGMTDVAAGAWHSVGLRSDGTAVACGTNDHGQCDVGAWTDVIAVSAGLWHTVGLRTDGTVVACGDNGAGQCEVGSWTDVAAVAAGAYHTAALRLDGAVVTAGLVPAEVPEEPLFASDWISEAAAAAELAEKAATVYIQGEGDPLGPWLYMDTKGIVTICIDYSEERELFRADMLATSNALPSGRVTKPSASGRIIYMPSVLPQIQARENNAVLAFTGDYIGFTSNAKGIMIRNGVIYYDRAETNSLAIRPDGTLQFIKPGETHASTLLAEGVRDTFSFGPLLVENGQRVYNRYDDTVYTMRVVLGYSDPYHFLAVVTLRDRLVQMTHVKMADVCVRYGCRMAYNMDGGHSTSLVFMGNELSMLTLRNTPHDNIRGLSDIIAFLEIDQSVLDARAQAQSENEPEEAADNGPAGADG